MLLFTCLSISILVLNTPMLVNAQCGLIQLDTDFFGNDLTYAFVQDLTACCNLCTNLPICVAYTYVNDIKACWLKGVGARGSSVSSPGRTSGYRTVVTTTPVVTPTTARPITAAPTTTSLSTTTTTTTTITTTTSLSTTTTTTTTVTTVPTTTTAASTTTLVTTPTTTLSPSTTTLITTTAAATTTKQFGCFVEIDTNYIDNDFAAQGGLKSFSDCCNVCGATTGCVAWAYWSNFEFCWMKNALPSPAQRQIFTNMTFGIITLRKE